MGVRSIAKFIWQNPGNKGKRFRKFVRAFEWQLYKRVVRKPRILTLPNGVKFKAYPDCVISSALQYADWPEYAELRYCRNHLKSGDVVVDVGANVGHFSLLLGDIVGPSNLICFEPTPVSWRRLVENFNLNGWPIDKLYHLAIGRKRGTMQFPDLGKPETTNCASAAARARRTVSVGMTSLDDQAESMKNNCIGLLKVDVEGYETEVFEGALQFFRDARPRLVMFESLGGELDQAVGATLRGSGYGVFQLDDLGQPDEEHLSAQNLLAAPLDEH